MVGWAKIDLDNDPSRTPSRGLPKSISACIRTAAWERQAGGTTLISKLDVSIV